MVHRNMYLDSAVTSTNQVLSPNIARGSVKEHVSNSMLEGLNFGAAKT